MILRRYCGSFCRGFRSRYTVSRFLAALSSSRSLQLSSRLSFIWGHAHTLGKSHRWNSPSLPPPCLSRSPATGPGPPYPEASMASSLAQREPSVTSSPLASPFPHGECSLSHLELGLCHQTDRTKVRSAEKRQSNTAPKPAPSLGKAFKQVGLYFLQTNLGLFPRPDSIL